MAARHLRLPGFLLGFSLGGFFDGILLHQILQWHHLLSGVADPADLPFLVLWDGLFHALHYLLAVLGLVLLLQARREAALPGAGRALVAAALLGFGAWHILDAVLFHWVLGLHRIRMDVAAPLPWDLLFFALGALALALGAWLGRGRGMRPGTGAAATLGMLMLIAAPVAALPPRAADPVAQLAAGGLLPAFCANWTR